MVHGFVSI